MKEKTTLLDLKREKEIQRRVRLVKQRLKNMPIELAFATGKSLKMPLHLPVPPAWACGAARISSDGMNKNIAHLLPRKGKKYTVDDLSELLGHIAAICSYVENPPKSFVEQSDDIPELAKLWPPIRRQTINRFHKLVLRITKRLTIPKDAPLPPADRLATLYERHAKGLKSFSNPDGEMLGLQSITIRIYFLIWMFWSEIENRFSTPKVHLWLKNDFGESPSDSSVEAVITRLRKEPRVYRDPNRQA